MVVSKVNMSKNYVKLSNTFQKYESHYNKNKVQNSVEAKRYQNVINNNDLSAFRLVEDEAVRQLLIEFNYVFSDREQCW